MENQSKPGDVRLNVCGMEPPEPMEKVLDALSVLPRGNRLCMLIDREPRPLYRILDNNSYGHFTTMRLDHLVEVLIWHIPD